MNSRSQWPRGLKRRSTAARLLRLWVRIPPGMDVCLLWVLCVVRWRSLRRAHHASRGVIPTVMRRCIWSRNLKNEEALAFVGPQRHTHTHTNLLVSASSHKVRIENAFLSKLGISNIFQRLTTGWTVRNRIPVGTRFFRPSRPALGSTQHPVQWVSVISWARGGRGYGLAPHRHLLPKVLEKIRAIPPLTLRTCVAYKNGENLPK